MPGHRPTNLAKHVYVLGDEHLDREVGYNPHPRPPQKPPSHRPRRARSRAAGYLRRRCFELTDADRRGRAAPPRRGPQAVRPAGASRQREGQPSRRSRRLRRSPTPLSHSSSLQWRHLPSPFYGRTTHFGWVVIADLADPRQTRALAFERRCSTTSACWPLRPLPRAGRARQTPGREPR